MASQVFQSIAAGSTTAANGSTLDNGGGARPTGFVAVCTGSAGIGAGAFKLQVSKDSTNWVDSAIVTCAASDVQAVSVSGQYRYARAVITTTVTGGTVGITVQNV